MKTTFPILCAGALVLAAGCSREAKKARFIGRADRDFAARHYEAAEIGYLNALKLDHRDAHALGRLGVLYFEEGRVGESLPCLTEGQRLDPSNAEVRLRLGLYDLSLGRFQDARGEADAILDRDPRQPEAPLLRAEAAVNAHDIAEARQRLEKLPGANSAPVLVALGTLDFRERAFDRARNRFRQALAADPKSSDAWTALAALEWAEGKTAAADQDFARSAEAAPGQPDRLLQRAQFKLQTGDRAGARQILTALTQSAPDFLPGTILLAELDEAEKDYATSAKLADQVLKSDPASPQGLLLAGRLKLEQGEAKDAVAFLEKARKVYAHFPKLDFELAQAYLAAGAPAKARDALGRAVLQDPTFAEAVLLQARLALRLGDPEAAAAALRPLTRRRPDLAEARELLAAADAALNTPDEALALYSQIATADPHDAAPLVAAGVVLLRSGRPQDARQDFEKALVRHPDDFAAVEQLALLDLAEHDNAAARKRAEARLAGHPGEAQAEVLLARVCLAENRTADAEAALRRAIDARSDSPVAYFLLAGLLADSHREAEALTELRAAAAKDPGDVRALMLIGMLEERRKDTAAARTAYEKVLAANPNFRAALNNLAYLDAQDPATLDRALVLAQRARQLMPSEPHVADTLGWILYQKHQYEWAANLLQEGADGLPGDPENAFHLGLARYRLGEEGAARAALDRALRLDPGFADAGAARHALAGLNVDPAKAGADGRAELEKVVAADPGDPIALSRLAAVELGQGAGAQAQGLLEAGLKAHPNDIGLLLQMARLQAARGEPAKAFASASAAHKLAPDDAEAAYLLGTLAYRARDLAWSASLLRQTVGRRPGNAEAVFELAQADYRLGRVDDAAAEARRALDSQRLAHPDAAREFIALLDAAAHPAEGAAARVDADLARDPENLPALMARGAIQEAAGNQAEAAKAYAAALRRDPLFSPAARGLALIEAEKPGDDHEASRHFALAREAYPHDLRLARAGGIIAYRLGDYRRAAALLQEAAGSGEQDRELQFYLGMARTRLKDNSGAQAGRVSPEPGP